MIFELVSLVHLIYPPHLIFVRSTQLFCHIEKTTWEQVKNNNMLPWFLQFQELHVYHKVWRKQDAICRIPPKV